MVVERDIETNFRNELGLLVTASEIDTKASKDDKKEDKVLKDQARIDNFNQYLESKFDCTKRWLKASGQESEYPSLVGDFEKQVLRVTRDKNKTTWRFYTKDLENEQQPYE